MMCNRLALIAWWVRHLMPWPWMVFAAVVQVFRDLTAATQELLKAVVDSGR